MVAVEIQAGSPNRDFLALGTSAVTYALLVAQFIYRHSDRAFLSVERIRLYFTGAGATWGALAEFGVAAPVDVEGICAVLMDGDSSARHLAQEQLRHVISAHGLTMRVARSAPIDPTGADAIGDRPYSVTVEVVPSEWPFRRASSLATGLVPTLFERVRQHLGAPREKYSSEVRFPTGNPYLGLFLREVSLSNVDRFVADIRVSVPGDPIGARVTASKDRITIVAGRISSLGAVSRRYLTLAAS